MVQSWHNVKGHKHSLKTSPYIKAKEVNDVVNDVVHVTVMNRWNKNTGPLH